jgi:hypothetical protein
MNKIVCSKEDFFNGFQNNSDILKSDSGEVKDDKSIFFITAITGTNVTVSDKDSTAKIITSVSISFPCPLRFDGGFEVAGTDSSVCYYIIPKGVE